MAKGFMALDFKSVGPRFNCSYPHQTGFVCGSAKFHSSAESCK